MDIIPEDIITKENKINKVLLKKKLKELEIDTRNNKEHISKIFQRNLTSFLQICHIISENKILKEKYSLDYKDFSSVLDDEINKENLKLENCILLKNKFLKEKRNEVFFKNSECILMQINILENILNKKNNYINLNKNNYFSIQRLEREIDNFFFFEKIFINFKKDYHEEFSMIFSKIDLMKEKLKTFLENILKNLIFHEFEKNDQIKDLNITISNIIKILKINFDINSYENIISEIINNSTHTHSKDLKEIFFEIFNYNSEKKSNIILKLIRKLFYNEKIEEENLSKNGKKNERKFENNFLFIIVNYLFLEKLFSFCQKKKNLFEIMNKEKYISNIICLEDDILSKMKKFKKYINLFLENNPENYFQKIFNENLFEGLELFIIKKKEIFFQFEMSNYIKCLEIEFRNFQKIFKESKNDFGKSLTFYQQKNHKEFEIFLKEFVVEIVKKNLKIQKYFLKQHLKFLFYFFKRIINYFNDILQNSEFNEKLIFIFNYEKNVFKFIQNGGRIFCDDFDNDKDIKEIFNLFNSSLKFHLEKNFKDRISKVELSNQTINLLTKIKKNESISYLF